jgi:hypothetical protein
MHVRAYNHWVSLLGGRAYPAIADLDAANITDFGPHSVLLDFTKGGDTPPAIAFLGDALKAECALAPGTASVADVPPRSLLSRLTDHYLQIIANRAPIGFEAEFVNQRGNNTLYRGILMPFSSDGEAIDFIYGVINWKEVADAALTQGIAAEVDRALQSTPPRVEPTAPVWADGPHAAAGAGALPAGDPEPAEVPAFDPGAADGLGDWLAAARDLAEAAKEAEGRGRSALYRALGLAYDFALAAERDPADYAELLEDSGITVQDRAPMTPIVKLVFGIDYDKTRLSEYALALAHARRIDLAEGAFASYLETFNGGLKGVVSHERSARRPERKVAPAVERNLDRARKMAPMGIVGVPGDEEFLVLVARRVDAEHVAVIGRAGDDALLAQALRKLAK